MTASAGLLEMRREGFLVNFDEVLSYAAILGLVSFEDGAVACFAEERSDFPAKTVCYIIVTFWCRTCKGLKRGEMHTIIGTRFGIPRLLEAF